jgi:hypothetical protein
VIVSLKQPGLGDLSTPAGTIVTGSSSSLLESPWLYIGGALVLFAVYMKVRDHVPGIEIKKKRRTRRKTVTTLNTAVLAAGAAAGGYLLGKYTGL